MSGTATIVIASLLLEIHQFDVGIKLGNIVFAVICLLVFRTGLWRLEARFVLTAADYWMILYLLWAAFSVLYSPAPVETIFQVGLATIVWASLLVLRQPPLTNTLHIVFVVAAIISTFSVAAYLFDADFAIQPFSSTGAAELRGVFEHQLRLGMLAAVAVGLLVVAFINGDLPKLRGRLTRPVFGGCVAVIVATLYLSQARSPTAALMLTLAACCAFAAPQRWLRYTAIFGIGASVFLIYLYGQEISRAVFATESDLTFSGRLKIWQETWSAADLQGWTGYGFASFSSSTFDWLWGHYRPTSAHNSLLQTYFETGYIGSLLMLGFVIALLSRGLSISFRTRRISYTLFMAIYGVSCSLMSVIYGGKLSILMTLILLISGQEQAGKAGPTASSRRATLDAARRRMTPPPFTGKATGT
ncbi:O-antigen ligase family protein [Neorhizobium sp. JUb45]|uniref:O-antigen ligase family protein n=1 Tax=unclassified Neorhizobium TaxID=2629175 RepID=UPI00104C76F1|nr:O-antigen ligase family protein [Neorhizobium sp. JUb45]TCQ98248.1 O-antigen ligase [Neorhizobium sp. JUb45]